MMQVMLIETAKGRIACLLNTAPSNGVSATVTHFVNQANAGAFNGRVFHRVEEWVIQGGDPTGTGSGGGEMPAEYNNLPFNAGALGVARGPDRRFNSDCQFFIVKTDANSLDGEYTNFGEVVEGEDVVRNIAVGDVMTRVWVEEWQGEWDE